MTRWHALVTWWCGTALVCASAAGQSLADVARAEAERRKAITQPSRVYTNEDLKPVRPAEASSADTASGPEGPAPGASPPERTESEHGAVPRAPRGAPQREADAGTELEREHRPKDDEARWRSRMAQARDQAERSRLFAEALQSRINALTADYSARDDPAERAVIGAQLSKALAELERVRQEIEERQKAVTDLDEEARRAGVPPGWLR